MDCILNQVIVNYIACPVIDNCCCCSNRFVEHSKQVCLTQTTPQAMKRQVREFHEKKAEEDAKPQPCIKQKESWSGRKEKAVKYTRVAPKRAKVQSDSNFSQTFASKRATMGLNYWVVTYGRKYQLADLLGSHELSLADGCPYPGRIIDFEWKSSEIGLAQLARHDAFQLLLPTL